MLRIMLYTSWLVFLQCIIAFANAQHFAYMPGRRVCSKEVVENKIQSVQSSVCIPVLQTFTRKCGEAYGKYANAVCQGYRTIYKRVSRTSYQMMPTKRVRLSCCPGWKRTGGKLGCTEPVCDKGCFNDGSCIGPNKCKCKPGFQGQTCNQDIDECKINNGGCAHTCKNTKGSFKCSCRDGFKIADDNRGCDICISCSEEWHGMELRLLAMERAIVSLAVKLNAYDVNKIEKDVNSTKNTTVENQDIQPERK